MTFTSSTVVRSFTGMLEIGEETVPATVLFSDGFVSLVVAGDEVGAWPHSEVDFVPGPQAYDIHAEGDSIRFVPDQSSGFGEFLRSPGTPAVAVSPLDPPRDPASTLPVISRVPEDGAGPDVPEPPALGLDEERPSLLDHVLDETDQADPPPLEVETPDEYYAAGLTGPPNGTEPRPFRPPISPSGTVPEPSTTVEADPAETTDQPMEEPERDGGATEIRPRPVDPQPVPRFSNTPTEPPKDASPTVGREQGRGRPDPIEAPTPEPEPVAEPAADAGDAPPVEEAPDKPLTRLLKRARATVKTEPEQRAEEIEETPEREPFADLPKPMSDSDNLKQWGLVVAGGVVLVAILGVVAWGVISLLGSEDPTELAADEPPLATTVPAPTVTAPPATTPITAPPATTIPPENRARAAEFVAGWNAIASDYAYHLTISADSLPISTAPTPTVHLTYDQDGVLVLTMVPKGTGSDRDILVAMGVAVAWADPSLSPQGRKELLGAMGTDVDNPQVAEMGGELARNGVDYSTSVSDGVIRFQVARRG